jgi:hypothetical protein
MVQRKLQETLKADAAHQEEEHRLTEQGMAGAYAIQAEHA